MNIYTKYAINPNETKEKMKELTNEQLISLSTFLMNEMLTDKNSGSLREKITLDILNIEHNSNKLGYDSLEGCYEVKPTNITKDGKLNGSANISDLTWKRHAKFLDDDMKILLSGWIEGRIVYIIEITYKDIQEHIEKQLNKQLPNGDIPCNYVRTASFSYHNTTFKVRWIATNIHEYQSCFTQNFYQLLTRDICTGNMIQSYINQRNSLKNLSDNEFENILPLLSKELLDYTFDKIVKEYLTYDNKILLKDWKALQKWVGQDKFHISATSITGMKILKTFMTHFYNVQNYKGISVSSLWTYSNIENALRFNRKYHSTPYVSELIRSLSFTNGLGKITMYRPVMAKMICSYFNAKSVLDVCVGWGGRMIGCSSLENVTYTGFEPCTKTFNGLCEIKNLLQLDNVTLIQKPAENGILLLNDAKFDIGLTSPPYYNLEIYSDEDTQSTRYHTYSEWVSNFLEPVVKGVINRVTYSCWSIKNFKTDKTYNLLDEIIRIHNENGWIQSDIQFNMSNSKRPGKVKNITKSEEITYVFTCK